MTNKFLRKPSRGPAGGGGVVKVRFNSSTDALVANGGFYDDGYIRLGWDASNMTEFMMLIAPSSGGARIHAQGTSANTNIYVSQTNYKYDVRYVNSPNVIKFWILAEDDASYPSYYCTVFNIAGSSGTAQLTVQQY